jgi:beta-mannanase
VTAGKYDSYIGTWASAAKSWGHPFFLRFNWEMNGNWFPWAESANGNRPGDYVAAWRHVHDLFSAVGATNVTWVWCPNIDPSGTLQPLPSLYPGDAYVDWTCLDGYNWDSPWSSFDQLFRSTYTLVTTQIAPTKPLAIGEDASTEQGGSKAAWISDALTSQLPANYPKAEAYIWFDKYDSSMDWPIESSSSATAAFANAIQASYYAANNFAAISASPIKPLP